MTIMTDEQARRSATAAQQADRFFDYMVSAARPAAGRAGVSVIALALIEEEPGSPGTLYGGARNLTTLRAGAFIYGILQQVPEELRNEVIRAAQALMDNDAAHKKEIAIHKKELPQ